MHLEAKVTPRPAKVASRLYPTHAHGVNCVLGGVGRRQPSFTGSDFSVPAGSRAGTFRTSPESSRMERAKMPPQRRRLGVSWLPAGEAK